KQVFWATTRDCPYGYGCRGNPLWLPRLLLLKYLKIYGSVLMSILFITQETRETQRYLLINGGQQKPVTHHFTLKFRGAKL
ncbi:MAG: hypothetical protein DRR00_33610, partial [Candidatus Parabeggiatoa sp. nov. 3]